MANPTASRRSGLAIVVTLGAVVIAVGVAIALAQPEPKTAATHYPTAGSNRTLVVAFGQTEDVSSPEGPLYSSLLTGIVPSQPQLGTVLTDANCEPDSQGISHCHNQIELPDGSVITVQHNHNMDTVPCLKPGEKILVTAQ